MHHLFNNELINNSFGYKSMTLTESVFSDNSDPELSFSEFSETFLKVYNTSFPIKRKVVKTNIDKKKVLG